MTKYYEIRADHTTCKEAFGEECSYELGKDECKGCETQYDNESQDIMDELIHIGYEVFDIHESQFLGTWKTWWVKVTGRRDKEIDTDLEFV